VTEERSSSPHLPTTTSTKATTDATTKKNITHTKLKDIETPKPTGKGKVWKIRAIQYK
jgi:hypothetical protein